MTTIHLHATEVDREPFARFIHGRSSIEVRLLIVKTELSPIFIKNRVLVLPGIVTVRVVFTRRDLCVL